MLRSYFLTAFRNLLRNKLNALVNIIGLAVAFTCSILLFLMVHYEFSFDKFQKNGDKPEVVVEGRIYQMKEPNIAGAAPGQQTCKIVVRDNGIGFDPKFGEQIFVVFQRLHSRSEYEGTGIGLAVCRKITDRHGGSIVAKSAEGQGAAFIVTLPVTQPSPQANE